MLFYRTTSNVRIALQRRFASSSASRMLSGHWKGNGTVLRGTKPSIPYLEEAEFKIILSSDNAVVYRTVSYTEHQQYKTPMHTENGFIKVLKKQSEDSWHVEAGFTHPFPNSTINEISKGVLLPSSEGGSQLILEAPDTSHFQRAIPVPNGGKGLTAYKRVYRREGDMLFYDQYLSFGNSELYHHLHGELELIQTGLFK